ncbi:MAG: CoA transferase [Promethearchaeota archaeon]
MRERTGVGQQVDASLFNTMAWALSSDVSGSLVTGKDRQATERRDRGTPLTNSYQTKDGRWTKNSFLTLMLITTCHLGFFPIIFNLSLPNLII